MNEQAVTSFESILENPLTLKIFIFVKSKNKESVGVREVMRAINMRSSSTVSRHLEKLDEGGLIQKLPSNRYILTSEGSSLKNNQVPITLQANIVKRSFVTIISYQISFLIMILLTVFIVIWFDRLYAGIIGLVGLAISLLIGFKHWRVIKKQMSVYHKFWDE